MLGVGNVALDVARILAKTADELGAFTEIPPNDYDGLKANRGRGDPRLRPPLARLAGAKFSPMELRELDHSPTSRSSSTPRTSTTTRALIETRRGNKQADMVAKTLENWAIRRDVGNRPHKLFLHSLRGRPRRSSCEDGKVVGLRTERTALDGTGNVKGTRRAQDWDVTAVYRAVGYLSEKLPKLPWDIDSGTVPDEGGRVIERAAPTCSPPMSPAGSGAAPSVSSATPRATPTRPWPTCWTTTRAAGCTPRRRPSRRPWTPSSPSGTSASPPGRAGTSWTPPSVPLGEPQGRDRVKIVEREDMLRESGA